MRKILRKIYLKNVPKKQRRKSSFWNVKGQKTLIYSGTWKKWLEIVKKSGGIIAVF